MNQNFVVVYVSSNGEVKVDYPPNNVNIIDTTPNIVEISKTTRVEAMAKASINAYLKNRK